jgi:hypothetical protein
MIKQLNSMKNNNDTDFNDVIDFIIETGDTLESVTSQKNMVQTMMGSSPKKFYAIINYIN